MACRILMCIWSFEPLIEPYKEATVSEKRAVLSGHFSEVDWILEP